MDTPSHQGFDVTEEAAIACVPDRSYMFLNLLLGGQKLLDSIDSDCNDQNQQALILSIAQDIVYAPSDGAKWTLKHIGLDIPFIRQRVQGN